MRFMMMVKSSESRRQPPKELMDAIGRMVEADAKDGKIVASGGLAPTAASSRVRVSDGKLTIIDGPFTETKEVVGGYAVMEYASKQEAVESAVHFMELHKKFWPEWEGETEVRQIFGPDDYMTESKSNCS